MRAKVANKPSRPTLTDVASSAQVSISTVSLVLAGKAKERFISDEVISRVQRAAVTLDYSPNMLVRSMQRGRTNIFSFYNCFRYSQRPTDLYTVGLFTAAARAAGDHGCNLLLFCDFSLTPEQTYHSLKGGHSDGVIIFAPQPSDPLLPLLRSSRLPVVLLNSEDELNALSSVKDDVHVGMSQIAKRLIELGHSRIALFTDRGGTNMDAQKRIVLLQHFLAEADIQVPEHWLVPVPLRKEDVREAVKILMQGDNAPTAIFCWDDYLGYLVLEVCAELNVDVPQTLSVIGYDGIAWPSRTSHILASVYVDLNNLASHAIDILVKLAHYQESSPIKQVLPVSFKAGTTLAPPCKHG